MEMAYTDRWAAEIGAMKRILATLPLTEERKWGSPTYTVNGKNVVIIQCFKEYFALGFFLGSLMKDPQKRLVQLGQVQGGRVMKFANAKEIAAQAATIKAYVREAIAVEKAGLRVTPRTTADYPVPPELTAQFKKDARRRRARRGSKTRARPSSPGAEFTTGTSLSRAARSRDAPRARGAMGRATRSE